MDRKPTDREIVEISKHLYQWEVLGTHLGITNPEQETLKRDYSNQYEYQKQQFLFLWRRKNGSDAKLSVLTDACQQAGENDMAEKIRAMLGVVNVAKTTPTPSSDQYASSGPDTQLNNLDQPPSAIKLHEVAIDSPRTVSSDPIIQQNFSDVQSSSAVITTSTATTINNSTQQPSATGTVMMTDTTNASASTHSDTVIDVDPNTLRKIYKRHSPDIIAGIQEPTDFANRLEAASIIDETITDRIVTTPGMARIDKATLLMQSVKAKLSTKDTTNTFVSLCVILKRYATTSEIAEMMMSEAGLPWPVSQSRKPPSSTIPPMVATRHEPAPLRLSEEPNVLTQATVRQVPAVPMMQQEEPDIFAKSDFSEFSNVAKYGKPGLSDMLNWIVSQDPSIWQEVGTELGLSPGVLNGFKMDLSLGGKPSLMFKEVLVRWERSMSKPYTWQTILEALSSPKVGHHKLANKIAGHLRNKCL